MENKYKCIKKCILLILIWVGTITIGVGIALLLDGKYIVLEVILFSPFLSTAIKSSTFKNIHKTYE